MKVMDAWKGALARIKQKGNSFVDDEKRVCFECENMVLSISDLSDVKAPLQWIRSQADWFYPSDDELKNAIFSGQTQDSELYAYGERIFHFRKQVNQIDEFIIPLLKEHPLSRRALVVLSDPLVDEASSRNVVSLISLWFRIVNDRLCVTATLRSNDFLLGWPANVFQVRLIQEYVAKELGIPLGDITTISLSAHFFDDEKWLFDRLLSS